MLMRLLFGSALLLVMLIGALVTAVFFGTVLRPGVLDAPIAVGFGFIGVGSTPVAALGLWNVRSLEFRKLGGLLLLGAVLNCFGWVYMVGVAH